MQRNALGQHLRKHLQGDVRFDLASRKLYSTDASIYQIEPLGVVIPRSADDLAVTVQVAAEMEIPITARGGGTSLSGQSIGPGIILDCSKYLNNVLEINPETLTARIQPGVVLDQLNRAVGEYDLLFGPEVSTSSRANLGGMMGNNSAGSRSIVYGKTIDHVRRLQVILSDGSRAEFGPVSPEEWERRGQGKTLEAAGYRQAAGIVRANRDEIQRRFPRILRRVSGYNLDVLAQGLSGNGEIGSPGWSSGFSRSSPEEPAKAGTPTAAGAPVGLHQLIIGSEGTLALIAEAEVNLLRRPKVRGLLIPQFSSLAASMDAVEACLELKPSAVELLDQLLLELTAGNLAHRDTVKYIPTHPKALLMVEFSSDDPLEVTDKIERLQQPAERGQRRDRSDPGARPGHPRSALEPAACGHASALQHARRPQAGHVHRGLCRLTRAPARVRGPLPRPAAKERHRWGLLWPCQRRLSAHPAAAQPEGPAGCGPDAANHRGCDRLGAGVRRLAVRRARRRPGPQRVEREDVWPGGLQRLPPGQAGIRPARRAQPRPGGQCPAHDREPALPAGLRSPGGPDSLRLQQAGRLRPLHRDVQRQRRVPETPGRDDVSLVPGHPGREGQHPRPGQRPAPGPVRRAAAARSPQQLGP